MGVLQRAVNSSWAPLKSPYATGATLMCARRWLRDRPYAEIVSGSHRQTPSQVVWPVTVQLLGAARWQPEMVSQR